jgi:hypothetical protein
MRFIKVDMCLDEGVYYPLISMATTVYKDVC